MKKLFKEVKNKAMEKSSRLKGYVVLAILEAMLFPQTIFASTVDANASWNTVMEFLVTWVPRGGAVILFFGAVEFAFAYKNEDANSKTNSTRLMIAGAMVIAIPTALQSLLMA